MIGNVKNGKKMYKKKEDQEENINQENTNTNTVNIVVVVNIVVKSGKRDYVRLILFYLN